MPKTGDGRHAVNDGVLVSLRGVSKRFGNVQANDSVDLDLQRGEIHALLGENGAGKSTLMKVLYGFYRADAGVVHVDGEPRRIASPLDARNLRIGMVFQTFTLVPALTVAENISLYLPDLSAIPRRRRIAQRIREVSAKYGLDVNPEGLVRDLCIGDQQKVEVLKLLLADARVLIFDEATRVLAPHEIESLFDVFRRLRESGYSIVFITHKMREVLACADRITVMRRGKVVGTLARSDATEEALVRLMFGDSAPPEERARAARSERAKAPLLELRNVSTRSKNAGVQLAGVSFAIHAGEIVGIAGVSGNGQREFVDSMLGLLPCWRGTRWLDGRDATRWSAGRIRRSGVGFIPEDPLGMAVVPSMTLGQNAALGDVEKYERHGGFALDWGRVREDVDTAFRALSFEPLDFRLQARRLSGGQLQRAVLARELGRMPRLLVASYPTRGLDVRSGVATRQVLSQLRDGGGAVLIVSEDLDELCDLSDRLLVVHGGAMVGEFRPPEIDRLAIGHLMTGSGCAHA